MSNNLIVIFLISLVVGCQAQNKNVILLEQDVFKEHIKTDSIQLIDVRTDSEFNSGHIKNAVNIDYYAKNFGEKLNELQKDKPIYVYCRSGNRSNKATNLLTELGFTKIYDLKGGILNWKD